MKLKDNYNKSKDPNNGLYDEFDPIPRGEFLLMDYEDKIHYMIESPERLALPEEVSFLAQYLAQYRPLDPPEQSFDNETSVDIQETMQSVCFFETHLISRIMRMLGYKLYINGISQPHWSMSHIDNKKNEYDRI